MAKQPKEEMNEGILYETTQTLLGECLILLGDAGAVFTGDKGFAAAESDEDDAWTSLLAKTWDAFSCMLSLKLFLDDTGLPTAGGGGGFCETNKTIFLYTSPRPLWGKQMQQHRESVYYFCRTILQCNASL